MKPNFARLFVCLALGACAAEPATHPNGSQKGSGSAGSADDGSDTGVSQGSGSGSGMEMAPPAPGTLYGSVLDERGDQIDFSTGEPVHTHAGPSIDLATGCPAVYKYAYLEDQTDPQFGRQTAINPLQWNVTSQVGSLDDSATQYRVRLDDGTVVLDWTAAAAPDDNGLYTVRLYRNVVAPLGDHTGKMWVDVKFVDTQGNETVDSACWENHPMAAPLEVQPLATSDLFTWNLPSHSPISSAIDTASLDATAEEQVGASAYQQTIVQHTAEPVTLHLDHGAITGTASMTAYYTNLAVSETAASIDCTTDPSACLLRSGGATTTASTAGALTATWNMHVVDAATGAIVCHNPDGAAPSSAISGCVLPARGANEAPHVYRLIVAMSGAQSIDPDTTFTKTVGEQNLTTTAGATVSFTGAITDAWASCVEKESPNGDMYCIAKVVYNHIAALDLSQLQLAPVQLSVQTAPDSTASLESIASYATPSLSIAAQSWDAGDAGLD
ncbi:MAG TPA: hypothetical protein VGG74_34625 [Kofleriaceae bacterium]